MRKTSKKTSFMHLAVKPLAIAIGLALGASTMATTALAEKPASKLKVNVKAIEHASVEGVTEYRLPNGLRILLAPDASKPTTTVNITYLVGSRHESYGETGMAHLLEHLVFKGTKTSGNILDQLSKRGMQFNGTTFYDRTNYFETFPSNEDNLKWALEMEADRMVNSKIAKADLDTEFSVVRNEMEIGENDAFDVLWKQLSAVTYDWHNYGHNTIGARSDVEGVKIENLQKFYRKFYQPDNAVLMVAGKFDAAKTLKLIENSFGQLSKPQRIIEKTWTTEAARDGVREITVRRISDEKLGMLLYPTSAGSHKDFAAVQVLSEVLGSTPNGRLHKNLVETKQAVRLMAMPFGLAEPGYAAFVMSLSKDQDIAIAKKTFIETVEGLEKNPVTEAELKLAQSKLLNEFEKTLSNPQRMCVEMSEAIAKGDWRLFFIERDDIESVKIDDVMRVAKNYLKEDNRSYGQFLPVAKVDRALIPPTPDVDKMVANYKGRAKIEAGEDFDATPANIDKRTEKFELSNGAQVAFITKKNRGETVVGNITLRLGDEKSMMNQRVNLDLASDMLMRGSVGMTRQELDTKLSELKAKLQVAQGGQNLAVSFETVRANVPALLDVIRKVLREPVFDAKEFELLQKENLTNLENSRSEPQSITQEAARTARNKPYQKGDIRYTFSLDENIAIYKAAKLDDVKNFYANMMGMNHAQVSMVGDFDSKAVKVQLEKNLGDWKAKQSYTRLPSLFAEPDNKNLSFEAPDKANAFFYANLPIAINDSDADYAALLAANEAFGGGPQSRLFNRLRQKEGISYGVGSSFSASALDKNGGFSIYGMLAPANGERFKAAMNEEIVKFAKEGITQQELNDVKKAISQARTLRWAQDSYLSNALNHNLFLKRDVMWEGKLVEKVQALTLEQVNSAVKKHVNPQHVSQYIAGDFAGAAKKSAEKK